MVPTPVNLWQRFNEDLFSRFSVRCGLMLWYQLKCISNTVLIPRTHPFLSSSRVLLTWKWSGNKFESPGSPTYGILSILQISLIVIQQLSPQLIPCLSASPLLTAMSNDDPAPETRKKSPGRWSYHRRLSLSSPSPLTIKQGRTSSPFIMVRKTYSCSLGSMSITSTHKSAN